MQIYSAKEQHDELSIPSTRDDSFPQLHPWIVTAYLAFSLLLAIDKLNEFINQVNDLINNGQLSSAEGQPLIDLAQQAIDFISEGS